MPSGLLIGEDWKPRKPYEGLFDYRHGMREDWSPKGYGHLGMLPMRDGSVMTEQTIGVDFGKGEEYIPLIVPTLSDEEIKLLMGGEKPTRDMVRKASDYVWERRAQGLFDYSDPY